MDVLALFGARVFDGALVRERAAVLVAGDTVIDVIGDDAIPSDARKRDLSGGVLVPGFIDLQVNGGGGVMLNDGPSAARMASIAQAHRHFGTTGLLPTLITDTASVTESAIAAAAEAAGTVPGVLGLHLEGPHLTPRRRGAHLAELMRPMTDQDAELLIAARDRVKTLLVTVAVEQVSTKLIRRLSDAGIVVSLGHTDAGYDEARAAFDAGARSATHLFNAMSQLGNRDPGVVGAVLTAPGVSAGVIADGHHVHPETLRIAHSAKRGPGRLYLVTDAMACVGTQGDSFPLNGRTVFRQDGRLILDDGTLAGADVDMASCVRYAANTLGLGLEEALRMASLYPAQLIGDESRGRIGRGSKAEFVHVDDDCRVLEVMCF